MTEKIIEFKGKQYAGVSIHEYLLMMHEYQQKMMNRLGWILFWAFLAFLAASAAIPD